MKAKTNTSKDGGQGGGYDSEVLRYSTPYCIKIVLSLVIRREKCSLEAYSANSDRDKCSRHKAFYRVYVHETSKFAGFRSKLYTNMFVPKLEKGENIERLP